MLERIVKHDQIFEIYSEFEQETSWYWWVDGAYPSYDRFEQWTRNSDKDQIGIFMCRHKNREGNYDFTGFVSFSKTDLMHGFSFITLWIKPSLRKEQGLISYGLIATVEAIQFAFQHYPLRKIYQNIVSDNTNSLRPTRKVFKEEGTLRDHYYFEGKYCDLTTLSVTRQDWEHIYNRYKNKALRFF